MEAPTPLKPADGYSPRDRAAGECPSKRYDPIGIIVIRIIALRPEIENLVSRLLQPADKKAFQFKSAVIRGDIPAFMAGLRFFSACRVKSSRGQCRIFFDNPMTLHFDRPLCVKKFPGQGDDSLLGKTELFHIDCPRGRSAEPIDGENPTGGSDIAVPAKRRTCLDGDSGGDPGRQHLIAVLLRLGLEQFPRTPYSPAVPPPPRR